MRAIKLMSGAESGFLLRERLAALQTAIRDETRQVANDIEANGERAREKRPIAIMAIGERRVQTEIQVAHVYAPNIKQTIDVLDHKHRVERRRLQVAWPPELVDHDQLVEGDREQWLAVVRGAREQNDDRAVELHVERDPQPRRSFVLKKEDNWRLSARRPTASKSLALCATIIHQQSTRSKEKA